MLITFLNDPEFIFYTVKWFQVFISNTNNSIHYKSFVGTQLNSYTYIIRKQMVSW